jgi:hypothetical protein
MPRDWTALPGSTELNPAFEVSDGIVTVKCALGYKCTQQGGLPASYVAKMLLAEIIRDPSSCDF